MATQPTNPDTNRPLTEDEADYSKRLFDAVLDTRDRPQRGPGDRRWLCKPRHRPHRAARPDGGGDLNRGLGRVPSERRKTGEYIGSRYAELLKDFIDDPACQWTPAMLVSQDGGKPN